MKRVVSIAVALVPWLALVRMPVGIVEVVTGALGLAAVFHGLGQALARTTRAHVDRWLAVQWGIATAIALDGLAITIGVATARTHLAIVVVGLALHAVAVLAPRRDDEPPPPPADGAARWAWPIGLALAVALLHTLGTAGNLGARPFDDETHALGQLRGLLDTGTLADPMWTRVSQFGGQTALLAFGAVAADALHAPWVDQGLALALVLALLLSRLRTGERGAVAWALLVVIAIAALPWAPTDPAAWWSAIGLLLALYLMLEREQPLDVAVPFGVVVGALATLRTELMPVAVLALIGAVVRDRGERAGRIRRAAIAVTVAAAVLLPYLVVRALAGRSAPAAVELISLPVSLGVVRVLGFAAVVVAAAFASRLVAPHVRWQLVSAIAGAAGIATQLSGDRPYATRFLAAVAIAFGLDVVVRVARHARVVPLTTALAVLAAFAIHHGREAGGRVRWSRRLAVLVGGIETLRDGARVEDRYDEVLRGAPDGARVGLWVLRPELVDHRRHVVIDLRVPAVTRRASLTELVTALDLDYVLVEGDADFVPAVEPAPRLRLIALP